MRALGLSLVLSLCGTGGALASSCASGLWRTTTTDLGMGSQEYAYSGNTFSQTNSSVGGAPMGADIGRLHGGFDQTDRVTGQFRVRFDGNRYCTEDFSLFDGVNELGASSSFPSLNTQFEADLSFDLDGNITDFVLAGFSAGTNGNSHLIVANSVLGDASNHDFLYLTRGMFGFADLAQETATAISETPGTLSAVPLPGSLGFAALGLLGLATLRRRT